MDGYLTPAGYGEAEHTDKKSRFIGRVWPVSTEAEALELIARTRRACADATHNVYAYIIRDGATRFSDDGEPGGTSGMPTLNVFRAGGVFNVCCVVTRYFGGVLLGSGGLVRAYSNAAKLALDAAGLAAVTRRSVLRLVCPYPLYAQTRRELERAGAIVQDAEFTQEVTLKALIPTEAAAPLISKLTELSAGSARIEVLGEEYGLDSRC